MFKTARLKIAIMLAVVITLSCQNDDSPSNTPPTISDQSFNVSETATTSDVFGTVAAIDADGDDLSFSISANDNGLFSITDRGQLSLVGGMTLDFETASSHTITVQVSDGSAEARATITINVIDVDENTAPVISDQSFTVAEDVSEDTVIGTTDASDAEGDVLTFSITTNDNGLFEISNSGDLSLASGMSLDYETATSHTITIEVSDGSLSTSAQITIHVTDVDENTAPVINDQEFTVAEDIDDLTVIGTVIATDGDGDDLTYSITTNDNGLFKITGTGELSLASGQALDFETAANHTITVTSSDGTLTASAQITINVTDVPENTLTTIVSTFAGASDFGFVDGQGSNAAFNLPLGITFNASGSTLLVADNFNHAIRRVDMDANVTTLAGGGVSGNTDANGALARFNKPTGIAITSNGDIYIVDSGNHAIRKINSMGDVTTVVGGNGAGFADGTFASAMFSAPWDILIDSDGNLIVSDSGNNRIRRIDLSSNTVSTIAGGATGGFQNGQGTEALFNGPRGLAMGPDGNIFVADFSNDIIRKIDANANVTTFAGSGVNGLEDGTPDIARFSRPSGLDFDTNGNLYVADRDNEAIRRISQDGRVTTVAGGNGFGTTDGAGNVAQFGTPSDIAVNANGELFVVEANNSNIRKIIIQ